jgi:hypothetical protein
VDGWNQVVLIKSSTGRCTICLAGMPCAFLHCLQGWQQGISLFDGKGGYWLSLGLHCDTALQDQCSSDGLENMAYSMHIRCVSCGFQF